MFARSGVITGIFLAVVLLMGASIGANAVAVDEPRPDVDQLMKAELFTDSGEIQTDTDPENQPLPELTEQIERYHPDTPSLDASIRQQLMKPMLLAGIWVADLGAGIGYSVASTIGVGATMLVVNGGMVGIVAIPLHRVYRLYMEVAR